MIANVQYTWIYSKAKSNKNLKLVIDAYMYQVITTNLQEQKN